MSYFLTGIEMAQYVEWCVYEIVAWPVLLLLVSRHVSITTNSADTTSSV